MSATLECRSLSKGFGKRKVLRSLDLEIQAGEIAGLIGENGCGKSTLLRCVAGYERPDGGTVVVRGRLGYCPQEDCMEPRLTLGEHLSLVSAACAPGGISGERKAELLERFSLSGYVKEWVGRLSGGSRQKLKFILSLVPDPKLLLLDEAYEGFDARAYESFWLTLRELAVSGCAIVLASHLAHERERFSKIAEIAEGRIEYA